MSAVTVQEIVEAFESASCGGGVDFYDYASRIKKHGIAPPDGWVLVPKEADISMAIAGMQEWDAAHKAGERDWTTMLMRVFNAMLTAANKEKTND